MTKEEAMTTIMTGIQQWSDGDLTLTALQDGIWQVLQGLENDTKRWQGSDAVLDYLTNKTDLK
jgi:hypothetical protein